MLELVSAEDFLASKTDESAWVLKPFLLRGSSMMIYGRQEVGKSSLIMQLAHSLISGEPWLGFPVVQTGPVILLELDMSNEELREVLVRAERAGMDFNEQLHVPKMAVQEGASEVPTFDIFKADDFNWLAEEVRRIKPVAVILDTAEDGFMPNVKLGVTELPIQLIRQFRKACAGAPFIFLRHERKPPAYKSADGDSINSPDRNSFSGPKEWEAKVTASLRLMSNDKKTQYKLVVGKCRAAEPAAREYTLRQIAQGFFELESTEEQLLHYWPDSLSLAEKEEVLASVTNRAGVYRDIAQRILRKVGKADDEKEVQRKIDALEKVVSRAQHRGAVFPWVEQFKTERI